MDVPYPERYHLAKQYVLTRYGDLEQCKEIPNAEKLGLYALSMQADHGPCNTSAPYMWNVTERYKHSAWSQLGRMCMPEAMVKYVDILERFAGKGWVEKMGGGSSATPQRRPSAANGEAVIGNLSGEVTIENVDALRTEIVRLRRLLARHGISSDAPPSPQTESRNSSFHNRSLPLSPEASAVPKWVPQPDVASPTQSVPVEESPPRTANSFASTQSPPPPVAEVKGSAPVIGPLPVPHAALRSTHTVQVAPPQPTASSPPPQTTATTPPAVEDHSSLHPPPPAKGLEELSVTADVQPPTRLELRQQLESHAKDNTPNKTIDENLGWLEWMGLR